jgi:hypothetical protein
MDEAIRTMSSLTQNVSDKIRKTDIILKLKPIEGVLPKTSNDRLVDTRLFTGVNNLHAIMDRQTCLWHLVYDNGMLPAALKTKFTSFTRLEQAVRDYMLKRNVEIVEIID